MPIVVTCPECAKRLRAPDAAAGKRVKCPGCGTAVAVPADPQDASLADQGKDLPPKKRKIGKKKPESIASQLRPLTAYLFIAAGALYGSSKALDANKDRFRNPTELAEYQNLLLMAGFALLVVVPVIILGVGPVLLRLNKPRRKKEDKRDR